MSKRTTVNGGNQDMDKDLTEEKYKLLHKGGGQDDFIHAPIDKLGVAGRWLRHKLLDGILVGTPVLQTIQKHRTPKRTLLMKMISFLGTEDFYTVLFLLIIWCLDGRLGRLFGVLMGIGFYAAGFFKSLLCLPRPPFNKVKPEEKAYDWALPSHHSLLGTILPWYIWIYINVHQELSSVQLTCLFLVISSWSFSVMFSRLYLGVHSPADIVSGGFVGVLVLSLWLQVDDIVDNFISQQKVENPLQCVLLFAALLYLHPKCDPGNPSFTDNCCLAGVVTGLIIGRSQRSRLLGFPSLLETLPLDTPLSNFIFLTSMRLIVGAIFVFVARTILKFIVTTVIEIVFKLLGLQFYSSSTYRDAGHTRFKHYNENFRLPPIYIKQAENEDDELSSSDSTNSICSTSSYEKTTEMNPALCWDVVVPSKCIVYAVLTYLAVEVVPQVFILIGL
ncbi:uncharacterized protein LOC120346916 [Styela clava]